MKIAQIAPTERVVSGLADELVRLGHDVTLFASGDARVRERAHEFDVLHFHVEDVRLPLSRPLSRKIVATLHGVVEATGRSPLHPELGDMPLVSLSQAQRAGLPGARWVATVHPGLPDSVCPFNPAPRGQYLAFLGRASPEKGIERAIEIARRSGRRLRIAAKVGGAEEAYWRGRIAPLPDAPRVEFVGELDEAAKPGFLGNALALLVPADWPEPFGLAMIEAMSCGTPVIAWPNGSVPEVVEHGVTGLVVDSVENAVAAVDAAARLDRGEVRLRFEERFSAARMARDYLSVYRSLGQAGRISLAKESVP